MRIREAVSGGASAVALAVAVFGVGGAFRWVQAIVAVLVAVAAVATLRSRRGLRGWSPLIVLLGACAVLTLLQLVPVPAGLADALEPIGAGLRADGADIASVHPWHGLSLDAPGTLRALCFFAVLACAARVVLRWSVQERARYRVLAVVAVVCIATAIVVGIHVVAGATSLYGIYTPEQAHPSVLGPLLNENHLGGLMVMGAMLSLGLAMYTRQASRLRALWLVGCTACAATALASQSRGAALTLVIGFALTGGVMVAQRVFGTEPAARRRGLFGANTLPIAIVAASTIVVIVYASAGGVSAQLERTTIEEVHQPRSKFGIWHSTMTLVEESPWVGVGRGAFEPTFTRVHPTAAIHSFSHVENEYIQTVVDWGIPGAIVIGLAGVWLIVVAARRWRDGPLAAGALGAVAAIALQNTVDFSLEMLGVALPAVAILATLSYVPVKEVTGRALLAARATSIAAAAVLAAAAALLLSVHTTSVAEDHAALAAIATPALDDVRPSIERHPLDYYGYALAAEAALRSGDPDAVRLLNHAMRLHPTHPGLHQLAARLLARANRNDQAALEYALALSASATPGPLLREIVHRFPAPLAAAAIPVDYPDLSAITQALFEMKRGDVIDAWLLRVLDARPGNIQACEWLYTVSLNDGDLTAADAAGSRCVEAVPSYENRARLARLFLQHHRDADAERVVADVETWTGRIDTKVEAWLVRCDALEERGALDDAKHCVRRLDVSGLLPADRAGEISARLERIDTAQRAKDAPPVSDIAPKR